MTTAPLLERSNANASHADAPLVFNLFDALIDPQFLTIWQELFEASPDAGPYDLPEFLAAEWSQRSIAQRSRLIPQVVWVEHAGARALACLLPKKVPVRQLTRLPGGGTLDGYYLAGGNILADRASPALLEATFRACAELVAERQADFLLVEDLDERSALAEVIGQSDPRTLRSYHLHPRQTRHRIRFPEKAEDYWQKFSSKTRSNFRRRLKKCESHRLQRFTLRQDLDQFLSDAHAVSLTTWQTRQLGLRVRNDDRERAIFSALARDGYFRSYVWYLREQPVAFLIGNQIGDIYRYEEVGFDPRYAEHSPGQMLLLEVLEDLVRVDPPRLFDFGGGDAGYKSIFSTETSQSGSVWLVPPGLRRRGIFRFAATANDCVRRVKALTRRPSAPAPAPR